MRQLVVLLGLVFFIFFCQATVFEQNETIPVFINATYVTAD